MNARFRPDQEDPTTFAKKLKSEGHTIVVIPVDTTGDIDERQFVKYSEIASDGYTFTTIDWYQLFKVFCNGKLQFAINHRYLYNY